ncbi:MAG: hypothetical protein OEY22_02620 [Candidatus Bathyarchaeota archaeon]|nr:hypothetical protein [Candidatus Bathyarchaeota archaeon]MDH5786729.1 hypothetical protein [Candidatus Bathyarchaeota archaeon]
MKVNIQHRVFLVLIIAICATSAISYVNGCGTPFVIEILSPTNMIYSTDSVPLCFTVNRATSWIGYSLDEQENVTIPGNVTLTDLEDGAHCVIVYARDKCGAIGASEIVNFAVDTTPPNITDVSQTPPADNVSQEDEVEVNATVTDEVSGVRQVVLYYYAYPNDNTTWTTVEMANIEGNIWKTTTPIPAFPYCTNVTYAIMAEDNVRNAITTVEMGYTYQYHVIPEFSSLGILSLFLIATLIAIATHKRRHSL